MQISVHQFETLESRLWSLVLDCAQAVFFQHSPKMLTFAFEIIFWNQIAFKQNILLFYS